MVRDYNRNHLIHAEKTFNLGLSSKSVQKSQNFCNILESTASCCIVSDDNYVFSVYEWEVSDCGSKFVFKLKGEK